MTHARGRHLLKAGGLVERYRATEFNPTFSRGVYRFASLPTFLAGTAASFIGLTPEGDVNRALGLDAVRRLRAGRLGGAPRRDDQRRPARRGRDGAGRSAATSTCRTCWRRRRRSGRSTRIPARRSRRGSAPRGTSAAAIARRVRGGYGLYYTLNNQQDLIVTVTNPPATPRVVIANPTFPVPPFERAGGISVRPIQYDIDYPRVAHVERERAAELLGDGWVATIGYAGARGRHLWRNADVNVPAPTILADGTPFYPAGLHAPEPELLGDRAEGERRRLLVQGADPRGAPAAGAAGCRCRRRTPGRRRRTRRRTRRSSRTRRPASMSAMPEFIPGYNKGLSDFHAEHNWVLSAIWQIPTRLRSRRAWPAPCSTTGRSRRIVRMRSGNPLTAFVQTNRSRSLWAPSLGPGTGPDRPSYAPGRGPDDAVTGDPDRWFDPTAFVLQPVGHVRQRRPQRSDRSRPDARSTWRSRKAVPWSRARPGAASVAAARRDLQPLQSRQLRAAVAGRLQRHRHRDGAAGVVRADPHARSRRRGRCSWACASCSDGWRPGARGRPRESR